MFVGVPVYNGERFLAEALDSLLAQSFEDFTLLISDNASTDRTAEICDHYRAKDPRVQYVRQASNIGAPRNWNFLAEVAEGDYFKWASGNDICAPTLLASCVAALDADPTAALCQGRTCLIDETTGATKPYDDDLALLDERPSDRLRKLSLQLALNNGQSGVIRLSMLRRTRLERKYRGGDIPLMSELAMLGRFLVLPDTLLYRRIGSSTFSRDLEGEKLTVFYGKPAATVVGHQLDAHFDLLRAALTLPSSIRERIGCAGFILRRLAWQRSSLLGAVRDAFKPHKA